MLFDDIYRVAFRQLSAGEHVAPYSASIIFFAIVMSVGWSLRTLNQKYMPTAYAKACVAIFLATIERCAYFLENKFIYSNYGSVTLFFALMVEYMVTERTFLGSSTSPSGEFVRLIAKTTDVAVALTRMAIQLAAAVSSFYVSRLIWSLDMAADHKARYIETSCTSDLTVVFGYGFLLEMGATFVKVILGSHKIVQENNILDEVFKHAIISLMVVLGFEYTGMYFNPAMASGHTLGCKGTGTFEHLFVYWAGPLAACFASVFIDKLFYLNSIGRYRDSMRYNGNK